MTPRDADESNRSAGTGGRQLVVVVHGLGDSAPGETVGSLARALAIDSGLERVPLTEVAWLHEGPRRDHQVRSFPCHVERVRGDGAETVLAEVWWGELSRVGRGILDLLLGVFRAVFGLHQAFALHGADPARPPGTGPEPAAWVLQKLSLVGAYLLRGPAPAATFLWGFGFTISEFARLVGGDVIDRNPRDWIIALSIVNNTVGTAIGLWGHRRWRGRLQSAVFLWLAIFGVWSLLSWLFVLVYPAAAPWLSSEDYGLGRARVVAFLMAQSPQIVVYWLIVAATAAWLVARLRARPAYRPGLDLAQGFSLAALGIWVLLLQFLMLLLEQKLSGERGLPEVEELMGDIAKTMTLFLPFALIPLAVLLVTLIRRKRWAASTRAERYDPGRPAARLLFARGLLFSLISIPILLLLTWLVPGLVDRLLASLGEVPELVLTLVVPITGLAVYFSDRLHFAIDFALDAVSHFERRRTEPEGKLAYVRRKRIRDRLRIVLETLVEQEKPDRVTLLAHSQGTIVSIEALAGEGVGALLGPRGRCSLVTMASPFHHVYQHYFPNHYPPLVDPRWDGLRRRVDRWHNIFRIDDPVGTDIEPGGEWPVNHPVDPGGHTRYWSDDRVLAKLRELL